MLDVVRVALAGSTRVSIAVSFFRYSGFGLVANDLRDFQQRGGRLRLLVSTYMYVTQPAALSAVLELPGIEGRLHLANNAALSSQGFHTKMYVLEDDPAECWVGSSNFTKGGLAANIEANLRHVGGREVARVSGLFEQLWSRADVLPLTSDLIDDYRRCIPPPAPKPVQRALPVQEGRLVYGVDSADRDPMLPRRQPNEAQREALGRLAALRHCGETRAAVVAAPGVGKTYLAAFDASAVDARSVLFLSNRLEHLTQAERSFREVFGGSRTYGRAFGGRFDTSVDLVFATVQSALGQHALATRRFDYVVVDEFHHAAAPSYSALLDRLDHGFLLGLTATPERQDGRDVLALCDYNVAYEVRLVEAINRGWLTPFHYFGISDDSVDYGDIPWRSGRFDPTTLENALMVEARVDAMLRECKVRGFDGPKRITVGFCASVRHARFMAEALTGRGLLAEAVTGDLDVDERERIYARLQDPSDALEWLFVADVLNEGVDLPAINSIVFLRPTESATVFIQQLGRGLRLSEGCEVLTVLDFVGHHKAAWLAANAIHALHDPSAPRGPSTVDALALTPPAKCEVVLDRRTLEVLAKVERVARSRKDACLDAYRSLKRDFGIARPRPVDLLSDAGMPTPSDVRGAWGSWLVLRQGAGDAEPWESALRAGDPPFDLLLAAEKDWQAQRVHPYAALWGLCARPDDPAAGYEAFFNRFPKWRVEYRAHAEANVAPLLAKKLGALIEGGRLTSAAITPVPRDRLLDEVEGRMQYTLEKDYRIRHGGILRSPSDLVLHRQYARPEIVNHFGVQYDPARHNTGVLTFDCDGEQVAIITKLDTSGALERHQYVNELVDGTTFVWSSQNRQAPDNEAGRKIVRHGDDGRTIHLFVQPQSHSAAVYLGAADVLVDRVEGSKPMRVPFRIREQVPEGVLRQLGVRR